MDGFLIFLLFALYFTPAITAIIRNHHEVGAIFLLNLLLGWTVIGWVGAAVWSVMAVKKKSKAVNGSRQRSPVEELEAINALRKQGAIDEAEFLMLKANAMAAANDTIAAATEREETEQGTGSGARPSTAS